MIQGGETAGVPRGTQNRLIEISQPELGAQVEFCRPGADWVWEAISGD
jgi:hypothetical protein